MAYIATKSIYSVTGDTLKEVAEAYAVIAQEHKLGIGTIWESELALRNVRVCDTWAVNSHGVVFDANLNRVDL